MNINTIDVGLNPIVLAQFRKLTRSELGEFRKEAERVLKVHRDNSVGGCLTPLGYLSIPQIEKEIAHYCRVIEHIDAVLKEWDTVTANGATLAREVVGLDTPITARVERETP